jgi:hypothetical protein
MKTEKLTKEKLLDQIKADLQKRWENRNNEHLSSEGYRLVNNFLSMWYRLTFTLIILVPVLTKIFGPSEIMGIDVIFPSMALVVLVVLLLNKPLQRRYVNKKLKPLPEIDIDLRAKNIILQEVENLPFEIKKTEYSIQEMKERLGLLREIKNEI